MQCAEARRALAGENGMRPEALEEARVHVAGCAECRARADRLASAILSGEAEELSCAECRARLDEQAASAMAEGSPLVAAARDLLVARHLEICPECEESWSLLAEGLAALAEDRLPLPESWPNLDLSFALDRPDLAPEADRRAETGWDRLRARLRAMAASGWLAGLGRSLEFPVWHGASRVALASLALFSAIGLAWLLIFDPVLPEPIRSISPFEAASATPDAADRAATQTMAVQMGLDWVEGAEELAATQTMAVQMGSDWVEGAGDGGPATATLASGRASPGAPTSTSTRPPGAGERREPAARPRSPSPTAGGPSQLITGTLQPKPIIPYPPPPSPTPDPYPGPERSPEPASPEPGDPDPTPTPGEAPTRAPTALGRTPEATP